MHALSLNDPYRIEVVEVPVQEPDVRAAFARMKSSAIRGSELKAAAGTNPGHQAAGLVEHAPPASGPGTERVGVSAVVSRWGGDHCRRGVQIDRANRVPAAGCQNVQAHHVVARPCRATNGGQRGQTRRRR
jgi:threonine dehydrogenase-like Zn-dependent dehydrogenase